MKYAWLLSAVLVACSSHESSPPPQQPASPSVSAAQAAAGGDAQAVADDAQTWRWKAKDGGPTSSYLLGVMGQSGIQTCAEDDPFDVTWNDVRPTIGRVGISGPPERIASALMDEPVVARGEPVAAPPMAEGKRDYSCAPMQARSDWRPTPRGILLERSPAPTIEHFQATAVRRLREIEARAEGEHVVVTARNPVPVELREVELRVHYEGCFGKPGTMAETEEIGTLGVGAQISARVPQLGHRADAPEGRDRFAARSVQLVASADDVVVDLDISLSTLGVKVECPDKRGKK